MAEQRRHLRFACDLEALIELAGQPIDVRVVDVSPGGICLTTDKAVAVASRVLVKLRLVLTRNAVSEALALPARVVWCTALAGEQQVGCMFVDLTLQQAEYLRTFLRFLRGEVQTQDEPEVDGIEADGEEELGLDEDLEEVDPDSEPFS